MKLALLILNIVGTFTWVFIAALTGRKLWLLIAFVTFAGALGCWVSMRKIR